MMCALKTRNNTGKGIECIGVGVGTIFTGWVVWQGLSEGVTCEQRPLSKAAFVSVK